jgi:cytochrome c556
MNRTRWYRNAVVLLIVAGAGAAAAARGQKSEARAEFMRQKLEFSRGLLEGLTRKDFPQIAKNAKALRALSEAAVWTEPKLGSQVEYGWLSHDFQQLTDEIAARAGEKNLDGATLGYLQLVANCVRCHRSIRDARK